MNLKERIELAKEQLGISEVDTQALEKACSCSNGIL